MGLAHIPFFLCFSGSIICMASKLATHPPTPNFTCTSRGGLLRKPPLKGAHTWHVARIPFGYAHLTRIRTGALDLRSSAPICARIMRSGVRYVHEVRTYVRWLMNPQPIGSLCGVSLWSHIVWSHIGTSVVGPLAYTGTGTTGTMCPLYATVPTVQPVYSLRNP